MPKKLSVWFHFKCTNTELTNPSTQPVAFRSRGPHLRWHHGRGEWQKLAVAVSLKLSLKFLLGQHQCSRWSITTSPSSTAISSTFSCRRTAEHYKIHGERLLVSVFMRHLPHALSMSDILEKGLYLPWRFVLQQSGKAWNIEIITKLDSNLNTFFDMERILGCAIRRYKIIVLIWIGTFLPNLNF